MQEFKTPAFLQEQDYKDTIIEILLAHLCSKKFHQQERSVRLRIARHIWRCYYGL